MYPSSASFTQLTTYFIDMAYRGASARERFAASVFLIRNQIGLPAATLATEAGISPNTLYLIEKSQINVHIDTLCKVAKALRTDPCAFFSNGNHPAPTAARLNNLRRLVGENIRAARQSRNVSQAQLTRELGLPLGYLGRIERTAPNVRLDTLEKIARELGLRFEALFADTNVSPSHDTQGEHQDIIRIRSTTNARHPARNSTENKQANARPEHRRRRSSKEKIAIVRESFTPGKTVLVVARNHDVNPNQVFRWRKLYRDGLLAEQQSGEQLVPASELANALNEIDRLKQLLEGKSTAQTGETAVVKRSRSKK
ncbi:transposase [Paraburkholderia flagellata]|uniref:transposase n=1 Tax=Paraburkholderia flagellata TaxID=2883241 RepID=UPI0035713E27